MAQENQELEELKAKCDEYLAGWKRERADFLNYKKEESARIGEICSFANGKLFLKILPILDNLYLAQKHIDDEGIVQIIKQVEDFLEKEGIKPIEVAGKEFDPNLMEAVEGEGDTVAGEAQRGYTLHGKVLRPAKVKLSK